MDKENIIESTAENKEAETNKSPESNKEAEPNKAANEYIEGIEATLNAEESSVYKVKLEQFEGPLDLLLHLIKEAKINIEDIFVSKITEQYLAYMEEIDSVDLDRASEFIEIAACLLEIKSKSMLPKPQIEVAAEDDPQKALIQRLEEYKLYKEASLKIKEMETLGIHYREPDPSVGEPQFVLKDITMDGLMGALQKLFLKLEKKSIIIKDRKITLDPFTVADKILHIRDYMTIHNKANFLELFDEDCTKSEVITTFQALLELLKLQFMRVEQSEVFGEIQLIKLAS